MSPSTIPNPNDGTDAPPALRCYLNMGTLRDLPAHSRFPGGEGAVLYQTIRDAGYEGVQGGDPEQVHRANLPLAVGGRITQVGETGQRINEWRALGAHCATVHLGSNIDDDDAIHRLVDDLLSTVASHAFPLYVETHRGTATQDMWRTVQLVERFPELRFNGDFSHWYTGHEMPYAKGFDEKLAFIEPVLERVRFLHGRIGNPSQMQVDIGDGEPDPQRPWIEHFQRLWTASFAGFLRSAAPGDFTVFAPELLPPVTCYARVFRDTEGHLVEDGDRWQQAQVLTSLARRCFTQAQAQTTK